MKRLLLVCLLLFAVIPAHAMAQSADEETGLAIRPAILDIGARKGTTVSANITMQNISGKPIGVEVNPQSLIPNDEYIDQEKRKDTDASTWMLDKGRKLVLETDETKQINVQFLVPEDASPGGHYALVTMTITSNQQSSATGSIVTPSISSLALITVDGEINENAVIGAIDIPFFIFGKTQTLDFAITNDGNVHILPTANIKLYDRSNKLVENTPVPAQLILPNTIKDFIAEWSAEGHTGFHRLEVEIAYGTPSKTAIIDSGMIFLMPDLLNIIFSSSIFLIGFLLILFVFKKPIRRGRRVLHSISYKFRIRPLKQNKAGSNKPQDIADISINPRKLDNILSSGGNTKPPKKKSKKIIIK